MNASGPMAYSDGADGKMLLMVPMVLIADGSDGSDGFCFALYSFHLTFYMLWFICLFYCLCLHVSVCLCVVDTF